MSVKIIFFCWVYNDFCSNLLLCDIVDFLRMEKSVVKSCLDKEFSDILSSFKTCWISLLRLFMALRRSPLRIDEVSLFETFGSLKIWNFGYTPSFLQLLRKSMSNISLFFLYFSFFYLRKYLNVTFWYFRAKSLQIFIIFFDSTTFEIVCKKITTFFKRHVSIILWSFSS